MSEIETSAALTPRFIMSSRVVKHKETLYA
jgi:hypothetical protein